MNIQVQISPAGSDLPGSEFRALVDNALVILFLRKTERIPLVFLDAY